MKNDKLNEAFDNIDGKYVSMTQKAPGRSRALRLAFIAAALALLVAAISVITVMSRRNDIQNTGEDKDSASAPSDERLTENVTEESTDNVAEIIPAAETTERIHEVFSGGPGDYSGAKYAYTADLSKSPVNVKYSYQGMNRYRASAKALAPVYDSISKLLLSGDKNGAVSPLNIYTALAMLAECTEGTSRAQILSALGTDNIEHLRETVKLLWEYNNKNNNFGVCTEANSVWLAKGLPVKQKCVDVLNGTHYASVFSGDFGDQNYVNSFRQWLSDMTNGLLDESIGKLVIPDNTAAVLASTLYYKARWTHQYGEKENRTFSGKNGDTVCVFNKKTVEGNIYEGDGFTAFADQLSDGNDMWFFLPDDGKTVSDVLESGVAGFVNGSGKGAYSEVTVRMPDFEVSFDESINGALHALGIEECMTNDAAFSALTDDPVYLGEVRHAVCVKADSEGIEGAAYTVEIAPGATQYTPPKYDFDLDRPFVFMVENNGVPVFIGTVNDIR